MIKIITFANGNYTESRDILVSIIRNMNVGQVIKYTDNDLGVDFFEKYKEILSFSRGYGYWVWKPFLILKSLMESNPDDIIFYVDSTDLPTKKLFEYINNHFIENDILLFRQNYPHDNWTKKDCFILMDCDGDKYHNQIQLEAGAIAIKKTNFNIKLMEEWLNYCSNKFIVSDLPNICGFENHINFVEHRHDQSILTNLAIKYDIKSQQLDDSYISYNTQNLQKLIYK